MTTRRSYNASHAEWVRKMRAKHPDMAALWGATDVTESTGSAEADVRKVPQDENERYAWAECLDAQQCVKGRGED